jgi:Mg-chelatase subunit ChlD
MSQLELDKGDNFIFAIDVSGSMQTRDTPSGASRIDYLKEQVITFAREASKYDPDGIDVLAFGHEVRVYEKVTAERAADIIGPLAATQSQTRTDLVIDKAYALHKQGGYKQTVLFLATDGEPTGTTEEAVKESIRTIAADIKDEHEFAISILTVGKPSPDLQAFLTDLDDNLKAKHDIVDVKALESVDFIAAFAGALHD